MATSFQNINSTTLPPPSASGCGKGFSRQHLTFIHRLFLVLCRAINTAMHTVLRAIVCFATCMNFYYSNKSSLIDRIHTTRSFPWLACLSERRLCLLTAIAITICFRLNSHCHFYQIFRLHCLWRYENKAE